MTGRTPARRRLSDRGLACVLLVVFAVAAWLDRDRHVVANQASIFAAIWAGISFLGQILGTVGGAIATSLEAVVGYLVTAVGWLASQVANILISTGAIFAKVWDAMKIVWSDVLKPALAWIDKAFTRVQAWLKDTFGPVFKWLRRVRDELNRIYERFVKPVVDTIEFIRQINRVLLTFHITVLQTLDGYLAELERRIREPILWLYARLTDVENAVNFIVTADGFFQRLTLLRSLDRHAPPWIHMFWAKQIASGATPPPLDRELGPPITASVAELSEELARAYSGEPNIFQDDIDALAASSLEGFDESALAIA